MYDRKLFFITLFSLFFAAVTVILYFMPIPFQPIGIAISFSFLLVTILIFIYILFSQQKEISNLKTQAEPDTPFIDSDINSKTQIDIIPENTEIKPITSDEIAVLETKTPDFLKCQTKLNQISESIKTVTAMITSRGDSAETTIKESENLLSNMNFITENIKKAFDIADNLSTSAKSAFSVSEHVQTGVQLVTDALKDSMHYSETLHIQSREIYSIIEMLTDVSSRINILSINASIVSARAGVHGKPFEVVAKEIRKLSEETDKSLSRIAEQINAITNIIEEVVEKIKYASEQTENEKSALFSVVGSLQGITLGVEVFRAVSKNAKEKSIDQNNFLENLISSSRKITNAVNQFYSLEKDVSVLVDELQKLNTSQFHINKSENKNIES